MGGTPSPVLDMPDQMPDISSYTVCLLGAQGVGKTALISQFMTSECINAYDRQKGKNLIFLKKEFNSKLKYYENVK